MARLDIPISDLVDAADLEAYKQDLIRIYTRFGLDDECQPHLRAERAREIHRANVTFHECLKGPARG